jgi:hypothetical protein
MKVDSMQVEKAVEAMNGMRTHEDLSLAHSVIRERHNSLPEDLRLAVQRADGMVAGGFVRDALAKKMSTASINTSGGDLDIFLYRHMDLPQLRGLLPGCQFSDVSAWPNYGGRLVATCAHPYITVQFIMPVPGLIISAGDILGSFDFTMNQVGYEIAASGFRYYLGGLSDNLGGLSAIVRGELVAAGPIKQIGGMRARVRRFIARGWEPDEYVQSFANQTLTLDDLGWMG